MHALIRALWAGYGRGAMYGHIYVSYARTPPCPMGWLWSWCHVWPYRMAALAIGVNVMPIYSTPSDTHLTPTHDHEVTLPHPSAVSTAIATGQDYTDYWKGLEGNFL